MKYVFLDTETNNANEDRKIIQLAFIVTDKDLNVISMFSEKYKIDEDIDIEAMMVHNITPDDLADKTYFKDGGGIKMLEELNKPENIFVAHKASFDVGALENEGFKAKMTVVDTLKVVEYLYPDADRHKLSYFLYKYKLYRNLTGYKVALHNALYDTLILKEVFEHMIMPKMKVDEILELMGKKIYDRYMKFGKYSRYRDENKEHPLTIAQIVEIDERYVRYILSHFDNIIPSQKEALEYWLDKNDDFVSPF